MFLNLNSSKEKQIFKQKTLNGIFKKFNFFSFKDETRLFETFSTYKIFTLELISIFCSLRVSKLIFLLLMLNFKFL
jgi:hypothetical protein